MIRRLVVTPTSKKINQKNLLTITKLSDKIKKSLECDTQIGL